MDILPYYHTFMSLVHPKHCYLAHFPVSGGYYDQPYREMDIYTTMLNVYRKVVNEKLKIT